MLKLKISGKEYPWHFGVRAIKEFALSFGGEVDLSNVDEIQIGYLGMKHGAEKAKKKFTISEEKFEEMLDGDLQAYLDLVNLINSVMPQQKNGVSPEVAS